LLVLSGYKIEAAGPYETSVLLSTHKNNFNFAVMAQGKLDVYERN